MAGERGPIPVKHVDRIPAAPHGRPDLSPTDLWCWRHPRAQGAAGRCIGRTDLPVDPRKAKRLAHRIRQQARRHGLPAAVCTSPLKRSRAVGAWLRRWGWRWTVDARLAELDFGRWDGQPWSLVPWHEVEAWQVDLLDHAPGGGETLRQLAQRARAFAAEHEAAPCLLVGHGGWIHALALVDPQARSLAAEHWPPAPPHGSLTRIALR